MNYQNFICNVTILNQILLILPIKYRIMKRNLLFVGLTLAFLTFSLTKVYNNSTGAPMGHTGAPGEQTCAISGCHGNNLNVAGSGSLTIEVLDGTTPITKFQADKDYTVRLTTNATNPTTNYGFQATVLDANNLPVGTLTAGTNQRKLTNQSNNKEYITHTRPFSTNVKEFTWRSPSNISGTATFYAAVNAANRGTYFVYSATNSLTADQSSSIASLSTNTFKVYPTQTTNSINIENNNSTPTQVAVITMRGEVVMQLNINQGINSLDVSSLSAGTYIVKTSNNDIAKFIKL